MKASGTTPATEHPSALVEALDSTIDVWTLPFLSDPATLASLSEVLAPDERERAGRFHFVEHQAAFIANRGRLRVLLARYLSCSPAELVFQYGIQGKPFIASPASSGLEFNLSHTDGMAIVAISRNRKVGIDIEKLKPFPDAFEIAFQQFARAEFNAILAASDGDRLRDFYRCWTAKEAFLKGLGDGLERPLNSFQISPSGSPLRLESCAWDQHLCLNWQIRSLYVGDAYLGALAFQGIVPSSEVVIQVRELSE